MSPGPSYNAITIQWGGINGATQYHLYESTSPDATPATATRIEGELNPPVIRSGLVAGKTYYYQITSYGSSGESAPSVVLAATATADFTFFPLTLVGGSAFGIDDQLAIAVRVGSRYQLTGVSATIGDRTVSLAPAGNGLGDWTGSTALAGLPVGATLLTFTATDVNGGSAQAVVRFDILPSFQVTLPLPYSVARPGLHLQASCAPGACYSIQVSVSGGSSLVTAHGSLDQTVSLASFDGRSVGLDFFMSDSLANSSGITVRVPRTVWVEASTHLQEVMTAAGPIVDATENRVLYSSPQRSYSIHNAASPIDTFVFANYSGASGQHEYPLLTPTGAWNVVGRFGLDTLFNWDRGSLTKEIGAGQPVVSGDFGIGLPGTGVTRITFSTGARVTVPGCGGGDVAANGDVVCEGSYQIFRFHDGVTTQLTHDVLPVANSQPRTDGINVVYTKSLNSGSQNGPYEIALFDTTEHILTPPMTYNPGLPGGPTYRANNGWVAYTQTSGSGELQVWVQPPGGTPMQVTHFGSSSTIEAVGPHGEVVLLNSAGGQARRYLSVSPYSAVLDIASGQGHAFFEGESLLLFIGPALYRVTF